MNKERGYDGPTDGSIDSATTETPEHEGSKLIQPSRVVKVQAFTSESIIHIILEVDPDITFGVIKDDVANQLHLKPASQSIFGLFMVYPSSSYHPPLEICDDQEVLPSDVEYLFFRKLCFDKDKEIQVVHGDNYALNLIFWEGKYLLHNGTYPGDHEEVSKLLEKVDKFTRQKAVSRKTRCVTQLRKRRTNLVPVSELPTMNRLYDKATNLIPMVTKYLVTKDLGFYKEAVLDLPFKKIQDYVDVMHTLKLAYWAYYYRILNCILCGKNASLLATYLNLNDSFTFDVVLNRTCMSFIGTTASGDIIHLIDFPWLSIRWISKDPQDGTISFEIPTTNVDGETKDMLIVFKTKECSLLFSIATHIMDIHMTVKCASVMCGFIPFKGNVDQALSLVPEGNNILKISVMKSILNLKQREPQTSQQFIDRFCKAPKFIYFNKFLLEIPIDLWAVLLCNTPPTLTSCYGNSVVVARFSNEDSSKTMESCSSAVTSLANDSTRIITVYAFFKGPYRVCLLPRHKTVRQFKESLISALKINSQSLSIFGLFECTPRCLPLDNPSRLCLDDKPMPSASTYSFRRLSFNPEQEDLVCRSDIQALKFILAEALYMIQNTKILPVLPGELRQSILSKMRSAPCYGHINTLIFEFWWTFYYRVNNLAKPPDLLHPLHAYVAVNSKAFFFADSLGLRYHEASFSSVRCLVIPKHTDHHGPSLVIEVAYIESEEFVLHTIPVWTNNHQFFYSIAEHLFDIQDKQARLDHPDEIFVNSEFKGPSFSRISETDALIIVNEVFYFEKRC